MGNNCELYELTGRVKALYGYMDFMEQGYEHRVPIEAVRAILGPDAYRKNGHAANEQDEEKTAESAAVNP